MGAKEDKKGKSQAPAPRSALVGQHTLSSAHGVGGLDPLWRQP